VPSPPVHRSLPTEIIVTGPGLQVGSVGAGPSVHRDQRRAALDSDYGSVGAVELTQIRASPSGADEARSMTNGNAVMVIANACIFDSIKGDNHESNN